MKQKISNRIFLILLFFLTWLDWTKFLTIPVSKISEPIPIFPQIQISLLKSKNPIIVHDAVQETAKMLLKYFVPELAEESWQTKFIFINLIPDNEPEIALTLSLPPERGILILLQKKNNHYFIAYYLDTLSPITKLESLPYQDNQFFLITRENWQKQLGTLSKATPVKLWHWQKNRLQEVFAENTKWEINWQNTEHNSDIDGDQQKWFRLTQNLTISYCRNKEKIILKTEGQQQFLEAPINKASFPPPYDFPSPFSVLKTREIRQEYYWNNEWHKFILATSRYLPPGKNAPEEIAVLKDLADHLESLAFTEQGHYQVINKKGDIFPLSKNNLFLVDKP